MLDIEYVGNPGKACALACYTMTAKYFFPEETSFEKIAKVSDWQPGYVVWAFKFWLWIMNKGIKITNYEVLDYEGWAKDNIQNASSYLSEYSREYTKDPESLA